MEEKERAMAPSSSTVTSGLIGDENVEQGAESCLLASILASNRILLIESPPQKPNQSTQINKMPTGNHPAAVCSERLSR